MEGPVLGLSASAVWCEGAVLLWAPFSHALSPQGHQREGESQTVTGVSHVHSPLGTSSQEREKRGHR